MRANASVLIDLIAGARPNFVKIAAIIEALNRHRSAGGHLRYRLIHTGQHRHPAMSDCFFQQLELPAPDHILEACAETAAEQAASFMVGYERLVANAPSRLCLVVGDVTSTMACAIAARKLRIPVAHVEAGIRCGDRDMPEEINRLVTDAISDWFFTTSAEAGANLQKAGVPAQRIFFVGNTMIDTLKANLGRLRPPPFLAEQNLPPGSYFVLTLHRPANVDEADLLEERLHEIGRHLHDHKAIFPVHPRTANTLRGISGLPGNILLVEPLPYLEFIWLIRHAKAVLTDSGGVSEEATVLGVPCMTLRTSTERPETVRTGTNELVGRDPAALAAALDRLFAGQWKAGGSPERWDGRAGERLVSALERLLPA